MRLTRRAHGWLRSVASGVARARTLGLAAEMSFWVFLSLVPLAALAGLVTARLAMSRTWIVATLLSPMPASVHALVTQQVQQVAAWRGRTVAPLAAIGFVWIASSGVHAVFDALEVQTGTSRPWWKKRVLAIGTCITLSLGVALMALLSAGLDAMQALAGRTLPPELLALGHGLLSQVLRWLVVALVAVAMVAGLYRVGIPKDARTRVALLPGAACAVVLQAALCGAYGLYVTKMGAGDTYQAGLAVVGVTLMTLWLLSVALLLGVQVNCVTGQKGLTAVHDRCDRTVAPGVRGPKLASQ